MQLAGQRKRAARHRAFPEIPFNSPRDVQPSINPLARMRLWVFLEPRFVLQEQNGTVARRDLQSATRVKKSPIVSHKLNSVCQEERSVGFGDFKVCSGGQRGFAFRVLLFSASPAGPISFPATSLRRNRA